MNRGGAHCSSTTPPLDLLMPLLVACSGFRSGASGVGRRSGAVWGRGPWPGSYGAAIRLKQTTCWFRGTLGEEGAFCFKLPTPVGEDLLQIRQLRPEQVSQDTRNSGLCVIDGRAFAERLHHFQIRRNGDSPGQDARPAQAPDPDHRAETRPGFRSQAGARLVSATTCCLEQAVGRPCVFYTRYTLLGDRSPAPATLPPPTNGCEHTPRGRRPGPSCFHYTPLI